jgi:hypothetical protein
LNLLNPSPGVKSYVRLDKRRYVILLIPTLLISQYDSAESEFVSNGTPVITALGVHPNPSTHGDIVTLNVLVMNSDQDNFNYLWSEIGPLIVSLSSADTPSPSFIAPHLEKDTNVTFSVTVSNEIGRASTMNITTLIKGSSGQLAKITSVEFRNH